MPTLDTLPRGACAEIRAVHGQALRTRLLEMGLRPAVRVCVQARAPFGGALAVEVGDSVLALRPEEAAHIDIQPV
jgi:Fe2+ transport system protein FeoA